ncbi:MAG: DNA alkylation repair protein, partial [Candidatus Marinimicrobia bacterium]|nr:DNA alkylation repair protein [Candidatus Neomarinimicrobiota bacterium]
ADTEVKAWWENYVKGSAPFYGVRMAQIRKEVHNWYSENNISEAFTTEQQKSFASDLIRKEYSEEKLAGILLLHEILLPAGYIIWHKDLPVFADYFHSGHIYDWNLCDWFCVKLLSDLIKENEFACADTICNWHTAENLWQARASVVSFVYNTSNEDYHPIIIQAAGVIIQRPERFAKTAVGWLLRELSQVKKNLVTSFINEYLPFFTSEVLKNSIKNLSENERAQYKIRWKQTRK